MPPMRFDSSDAWLNWLEQLHPNAIDLGLERVGTVWRRMGLSLDGIPVITVAGTNGKGSSVALLEAIYRAAGYAVCAYTSPHLHRYHERIRLDGRQVAETALCEAFERVDRMRGDISLTYFEFGTLAALDLFVRARPDLIVLEVGLGGRLDAVNIIDADIALISSIDRDHEAWLGSDINQIAREKAGILRPGRPAVFNGAVAPTGLLDVAQTLGAYLHLADQDYQYAERDAALAWSCRQSSYASLPLPNLPGQHQLDNAAAVLMVVQLMQSRLPVSESALAAGLRDVVVPGRFQCVAGDPPVYLDVAHNPQAARALAAMLAAQHGDGRWLAVFGVLDDKDLDNILTPLLDQVDGWYLARPDCPRGRDPVQVAAWLGQRGFPDCPLFASVGDAFAAARAAATAGDRLLVFGSFYTVAEVASLL